MKLISYLSSNKLPSFKSNHDELKCQKQNTNFFQQGATIIDISFYEL
jgi:hypothetical protein